MTLRTALVGGAALALLVAAPAAAHNGDHATEVGWWTSQPGAAEAPDQGFEVAAFAGEPVSVAALRFTVSGSPTSATLTLVEAEGATVTPATALQVCSTADPWKPADPGAMGEAPKPDCTNGVDLTRDEAAKTWTGDVGALLAAGSLMVVPGEVPAGGAPLDPGFRLQLTEAALAVTAAPDISGSPAFAEPGGSGGSSSFSPSPSSSGSFSAPAAPLGSVEAAPPPAPDAGTTPTTVVAEEAPAEGEEVAFEGFAEGAEPVGGGKPWARLLLLVPLSAVGGLASVYGKKALAQRGMVEA